MVSKEVAKECSRQLKLWGEQNHSPEHWLAILTEEVGEVAHEVCEVNATNDGYVKRLLTKKMREELIQVAAVAVSFVESLDRNQLSNISALTQVKLSDTVTEQSGTIDIIDYCAGEYKE